MERTSDGRNTNIQTRTGKTSHRLEEVHAAPHFPPPAVIVRVPVPEDVAQVKEQARAPPVIPAPIAVSIIPIVSVAAKKEVRSAQGSRRACPSLA